METVVFFSVVLIVAFLAMGGREIIGDLVNSAFPKRYINKGDKVDIFLDGKFNRTATVTGIRSDSVEIYDRFRLQVDYRGRFYATGVNQNDGSKLVYVKVRKHYRLVRAAEIVRKVFNVFDDYNMLPVKEGEHSMVGDLDDQKEESEEDSL